MAILGDQREVVIAGQPIPGQKGPACIAAIGLDQPHQLKGPWVRQRTTTMTSITVLPEQAHFAIGDYARLCTYYAVWASTRCNR